MRHRRRRTKLPLIPYLTALGASTIAWILFGPITSAPVFLTVFVIVTMITEWR